MYYMNFSLLMITQILYTFCLYSFNMRVSYRVENQRQVMLKRFYRRGFLTTQLCDHVISSSAFLTSVCRLQELHFCCFDLSENGPRQQMFFKTFSPLWFPHLSILDYPRTLDGKQLLTGRQIQILISFFFFFLKHLLILQQYDVCSQCTRPTILY